MLRFPDTEAWRQAVELLNSRDDIGTVADEAGAALAGRLQAFDPRDGDGDGDGPACTVGRAVAPGASDPGGIGSVAHAACEFVLRELCAAGVQGAEAAGAALRQPPGEDGAAGGGAALSQPVAEALAGAWGRHGRLITSGMRHRSVAGYCLGVNGCWATSRRGGEALPLVPRYLAAQARVVVGSGGMSVASAGAGRSAAAGGGPYNRTYAGVGLFEPHRNPTADGDGPDGLSYAYDVAQHVAVADVFFPPPLSVVAGAASAASPCGGAAPVTVHTTADVSLGGVCVTVDANAAYDLLKTIDDMQRQVDLLMGRA